MTFNCVYEFETNDSSKLSYSVITTEANSKAGLSQQVGCLYFELFFWLL